MNITEKIKKHNLLLEEVRKLEINLSNSTDKKEIEKIELKKANAINEISKIRKELGYKGCTIISSEDIKS